jgi:ABC-2 type transport system permease protein
VDSDDSDEKPFRLTVKGTVSSDAGPAAADKPAVKAGSRKPTGINAIYVGDIDVLSNAFVEMRNEPNRAPAKFHFDNVPFVCNVIDAVAGDERFLEIRKHKPKHSTLRLVEKQATNARNQQRDDVKKKEQEFKSERDKAEAAAKQVYADLEKFVKDAQAKQALGEEIDVNVLESKVIELQLKKSFIDQQLASTRERKQRELDQQLKEIERKRDQDIDSIQNNFKILAVLPAFAPIFIGLIVWAYRTMREREGVSRNRMRS